MFTRQLYLQLLKDCLLNTIYEDPPLGTFACVEPDMPFDRERRLAGKDWPSQAHTMIGLKRLDNIQALIEDVLASGVDGDLLEAGVWRGGATIFMRGVLKAYDVTDRAVWVADSFSGLPDRRRTSARSYTSPEWRTLWRSGANNPDGYAKAREALATGTSHDEVKANFARYHLLDDQVKFLPGWFRDTLPSIPLTSLALLRLDGDLYDSTLDVLTSLYPKVAPGGYVIVDDYYSFTECREAVSDYLHASRQQVTMEGIDEDAVYWKKPPSVRRS